MALVASMDEAQPDSSAAKSANTKPVSSRDGVPLRILDPCSRSVQARAARQTVLPPSRDNAHLVQIPHESRRQNCRTPQTHMTSCRRIMFLVGPGQAKGACNFCCKPPKDLTNFAEVIRRQQQPAAGRTCAARVRAREEPEPRSRPTCLRAKPSGRASSDGGRREPSDRRQEVGDRRG